MCVFCKAASAVLDALWEDPDVRAEFAKYGADLNTLGPLTHEVFVPAYRKFKDTIDMTAVAMLDADVTKEVIGPHYDKKSFREAWDEWGDATRGGFVREQSEVKMAQLLTRFYASTLARFYLNAYIAKAGSR